MRAQVVRPGSRLLGAKPRCCPEKIAVGQVVFWWQTKNTYGETRFVLHAECMAASAAEAPVGAPVKNVRARYYALRRAAERAA